MSEQEISKIDNKTPIIQTEPERIASLRIKAELLEKLVPTILNGADRISYEKDLEAAKAEIKAYEDQVVPEKIDPEEKLDVSLPKDERLADQNIDVLVTKVVDELKKQGLVATPPKETPGEAKGVSLMSASTKQIGIELLNRVKKVFQ